jgi:hypothetical protein
MGSESSTIATTQNADESPVAKNNSLPSKPPIDEKPPENIAPRPHRITILMGLLPLLSPAIAIVALFLSFKAIDNSRQQQILAEKSVRIAQRSYIGAHIDIRKEMLHDSQWWRLNLEMDNTGNTPATTVSIVSVDQINQSEKLLDFVTLSNEHHSFFISGKDKVSVPIAGLLADKTAIEKSHTMSMFVASLAISFRYSDVFGDEHNGKLTCHFLYRNEDLLENGCESSAWETKK